MNYYISTILNENFHDSIEKVKTEITKEGFGVVSELDLKKKFKEKLDVSYEEYLVLGICQPKFAYEVLEEEPHIGVFLPCNIVIREIANGKTEVFAVDPVTMISNLENEHVLDLAQSINASLVRVIENIQGH